MKGTNIERLDLVTKSEFSRRFSIPRTRLDMIIQAGLLDTEEICQVKYINITNRELISEALRYQFWTPKATRPPAGLRPRKRKSKKPRAETPDEKFDREWKEFHENL